MWNHRAAEKHLEGLAHLAGILAIGALAHYFTHWTIPAPIRCGYAASLLCGWYDSQPAKVKKLLGLRQLVLS